MSTDINFRSYAGQSGLFIRGEVLAPSQTSDWSDVLKLSGVKDSQFIDGEVWAGEARENALDANNRCEGVRMTGYKLHGGRQCAIVIKGGCLAMNIGAEIEPHTDAAYDVEWDGYSDQSRDSSEGVLNVTRTDGKLPRLVFGRFRRPLAGKPYQTLWLRSVALHAYNLGKDLYVSTFG